MPCGVDSWTFTADPHSIKLCFGCFRHVEFGWRCSLSEVPKLHDEYDGGGKEEGTA